VQFIAVPNRLHQHLRLYNTNLIIMVGVAIIGNSI
jgi:hypothetical protein